MRFEKKEVIQSMTEEEQLKGKVAFYQSFIVVLQIVEFGTAFWYVANVMDNKEILSTGGQIAWILQYFFLLILIVLMIDLQGMAFYDGSLIFDKSSKDKISPVGWCMLYIGLSAVIIFGDMEGMKHGAKKHFGYTPQKIEDYSKDSKYKNKESYRAKLESEKQSNLDKAEVDLKKCLPCAAIASEYNVKIAEKKRQLRHSNKPQDAKWISNINQGVNNEISKIVAQKEAAILATKAKIEERRDSVDGLYVAKINAADTSIASLSSLIDKYNVGEDEKKDKKEKQIDSFATGIAPFTQGLLFILRFLLIRALIRSGYAWHAAGAALRAKTLLSSIKQWFDTHTYEWTEKGKIDRTFKLATVVENVEKHIDTIGTPEQVEKVRTLLDNNAKTPLAAKALLVKKREPQSASAASVSEADYYKDVISTFTLFYKDASDTDPQKGYYKDIIDTFTLFLNDLK